MRNAACRDRADAAGDDRFAALDDQPSARSNAKPHTPGEPLNSLGNMIKLRYCA